MRLPLAQDPSHHFDYADLTWFHNPVYDSPGAILLTTGWFFVLVLAFFLMMARRFEPHRFGAKQVRRLFALSAVLLAAPLGASLIIERTGGPADSIPNFAGHVRGDITADTDGEFTGWARERYGLELNPAQARELQNRQNRGLFVPSTQTRPVIHDGNLIHGILAADQIILVDSTGTELPTVPGKP